MMGPELLSYLKWLIFKSGKEIDVQKRDFDGRTIKDQPVQYIAKSMAFKDSEKLI